ncbi:GGDEF domain-containing protein [Tsukamurella tyrosinosolvens]|uniref:GGDEF domain-containing protein n=1 Tax=Tsukamurella tyrosinosolvens TaxID=57704 RepID=UPI001CE09CC5|nr:GGDEF domain-containing protein [Tsukamurella tyrosinosolvens]MCA4997297.1 GGDEF domain-containing protein [Tsukamurella tyrosinosolvens]
MKNQGATLERNQADRSVGGGRGAPIADVTDILSHVHISERVQRFSIAGLTLLVGVIGFISSLSPRGAFGSPVRFAAILVISASTIPVAVLVSRVNLGDMWWSGRARRGFNMWFVIYSDIGFTAGLATFQDPSMSLQGAGMFAIIGGYAAHFSGRRTFVFHILWSSGAIIAFGMISWVLGKQDGTSALYGVMVILVASNGIVSLLRLYNRELRHTLGDQFVLATTDPLTGALNRRGFLSRASNLISVLEAPASVLLVDIDYYKRFNDVHGHAVGDQVLQLVGRVLAGLAGADAVIGRIGGDEFAIALEGDEELVLGLCERILAGPTELASGERITVSIGAHVVVSAAEMAPDAIIEAALLKADKALYRAKSEGRATFRIDADDDAPPAAV